MTREEYETKIDEKLKAVKEELMAEYKEEKLELVGWKVGDKYFYRSSIGTVNDGVVSTTNDGSIHEADVIRITHGYAKHTKEEVQFQIERDAVLYELNKFAEPKDAVWDGTEPHYLIAWNFWEGGISVEHFCTYKGNDIYFASKEDAEKAIQAVGEERVKRFYLGVGE